MNDNFKCDFKQEKSNEVELVASNLEAILKSSTYSLAHEDIDLLNTDEMRGVRMLLEITKPEQVIEKMIQGRMKKFLAEVTLLGQDFVINPDLTVEAAAREAGVEIVSYVRMAVGEGIEKVEEDFAAEVAKAAQS